MLTAGTGTHVTTGVTNSMRHGSVRRIPGHVALAGFLVLIYLAISIYMALRAPCGAIHCLHLAGGKAASYLDPDAFYMAPAVSFFREPKILYPGHPAITLQGIIGLVAELACRIFGQGSGDAAYYGFVLRHWIRILIALRILMTFVSLGCVFLVYGLARYCTRTRGWAVVAAALYATSYPVLLYVNRAAPEPLTMLFSLAAVYCLWRAIRVRRNGQTARTALWLCLAGMAGAATCFEKFYNGLLLLPVLGLGWLLEWRTWAGGQGWRYAFRFAGALILGFLLASVLFVQKLDIQEFCSFWGYVWTYTSEVRAEKGVTWSLQFVLDLFTRFSLNGSKTSIKGGVLLLTELPLLLFGCLGLSALRGQDWESRRRMLILALFGATAIVLMILRGAHTETAYTFYYFYPLLSVASVFSALALQKLVTGWCRSEPAGVLSRHHLVMAGLFVLLLHQSAVIMYITSERGLIRSYDKTARDYVRVLARLPAGKRIGVNLDKALNTSESVFLNLYMLGSTPPDATTVSEQSVPSLCWRFADRLFCITNGAGPVAWPDDVAVVIADEIESWPPRDSGCVP